MRPDQIPLNKPSGQIIRQVATTEWRNIQLVRCTIKTHLQPGEARRNPSLYSVAIDYNFYINLQHPHPPRPSNHPHPSRLFTKAPTQRQSDRERKGAKNKWTTKTARAQNSAAAAWPPTPPPTPTAANACASWPSKQSTSTRTPTSSRTTSARSNAASA